MARTSACARRSAAHRLAELHAASTAASADLLKAEQALLSGGISGLARVASGVADVRAAMRRTQAGVAALAGDVRGARAVAAAMLTEAAHDGGAGAALGAATEG